MIDWMVDYEKSRKGSKVIVLVVVVELNLTH